MRAILINSKERKVEEIDFTGDFREIQKLIDVDLFTVVELENGDSMFVDDEGLINGTDDFFMTEDLAHPLAGSALILGTDFETGENVATEMEVPEVQFFARHQVELMSLMGAF